MNSPMEPGVANIATAPNKDLLTPGEVARLFGVDPKTVTRWASAGKLTARRTLGGHRRYSAEEVRDLLRAKGIDGDDGYGVA